MPRLNPQQGPALARAIGRAAVQGGVITAAQALGCGLSRGDIRRAADSGRWRRVHPGVFAIVGDGNDLSARMWAAHLALGPDSVVTGEAAGHYWGILDGDLPQDEPVLMLISEPSHMATSGLRTRRVPDPVARAHSARRPPVVTVENAVLELVRLADTDADAVAIILRACMERLTTPQRLLEVTATRARQRRRPLVKEVCAELTAGVTSPLELAYRRRVALPHGLPIGRGQSRVDDAGGAVYRDVLYEAHKVIVELDGRRGHEGEVATFRDQRRDNHATLTGHASLRYGWLAVFAQPCDAAAQVGSLLRIRGWAGILRPCGPGCPVRHLRLAS